MTVHPLWRPYETPSQEETDKAFVAGREPRTADGRVDVVAYDPAWPATYARVAGAVREALGDVVVAIEHVGSTSVPGLAAKPFIDVDLVVTDPADEASYVPALERLGYVLRVREPWWEEHRMLRLDDPRANLHVFGRDAAEPQRHLLFRERLRTDAADRAAYAALKTELATREFGTVMEYNAAKSALIYAIYERAFAADPAHPHDPQPLDR
ncbi:GrpB family protein [Mumia sp. DW29H23]|uniref:GrpB family protein n=1 Tax=Mumia sp. DW29H23 TaxID=3421241 RepID=UPI003D689EE6